MATTVRGVVEAASRRAKRREILGAVLAALLIVGPTFGLGWWFGWRSGRQRIRIELPLYLDTREFSIAGGGVQYVVSYLRGDEVVEVPTYSPEARDRVIERLTR